MWEYKKNKEPKRCRTIVEIEKDVFVDIHTDINLYDFNKKKAWKGDLV